MLGYLQKPASATALCELLKAYGPSRAELASPTPVKHAPGALSARELFAVTGGGPQDAAGARSVAEQWIAYF
ncbi:hypothetical protein ALP29_200081 [Pseudomonas syringae pv. avii]|uniref:Uncharacterized protein n=1 Tax=Pseudomonas syringae pv. avii TaxID=663959 RepID=A0A3M5W485_PSESX|nr:hypothetical protein ALP29_200081 [Pseudomonas syringae pv. avii]